jgi:hypothetical protein
MPANKNDSVLAGLVAPHLLAARRTDLPGVATMSPDDLREDNSACDNCKADQWDDGIIKHLTDQNRWDEDQDTQGTIHPEPLPPDLVHLIETFHDFFSPVHLVNFGVKVTVRPDDRATSLISMV